MMRCIRLFVLVAVLVAPNAARAQDPSEGAHLPRIPAVPPGPYERGCRGDEIHISMSAADGALTSYPVVTQVAPGSPAAVAGLRVEDEVVTQDGVDMVRGQLRARRFAAGDTVWLEVRRAGTLRSVTLVMGHTVNDGVGGGRSCRPVTASARP